MKSARFTASQRSSTANPIWRNSAGPSFLPFPSLSAFISALRPCISIKVTQSPLNSAWILRTVTFCPTSSSVHSSLWMETKPENWTSRKLNIWARWTTIVWRCWNRCPLQRSTFSGSGVASKNANSQCAWKCFLVNSTSNSYCRILRKGPTFGIRHFQEMMNISEWEKSEVLRKVEQAASKNNWAKPILPKLFLGLAFKSEDLIFCGGFCRTITPLFTEKRFWRTFLLQ